MSEAAPSGIDDMPLTASGDGAEAPSGRPHLDIGLFRSARGRPVVFASRRALAAYTASEKDRFVRFVRRMMRSKNRVVRFVGRVTRMGHRYYQKLEDRIDPHERMIKALNYPGLLQVWHPSDLDPRAALGDCLRRQVAKHTTWVVLDSIVTLIAIALAPFLVPIPGPNVSFFYPFLRLLSHYRALAGARRGLSATDLRFMPIPAGSGEDPDPPGDSFEGLNEYLERVR